MTKNKEFLYSYLNAFSPVGNEKEGQKIWINYVKDFLEKGKSDINVDAYGTAWVVRKSDTSNAPKVVIEAHCDEIAWIINRIEKNGFIRVDKAGGSDNMIAASKTVLIHTNKGDQVKGVFGSNAIHIRKKRTDIGPEIHELWIDCGFESDKDVMEAGIEVGNLVTFDDKFHEMGNYYVGKSLDNKIGGYIIAEVLRKIYDNDIKLPFDLYVVNAVQEEVGLFGSRKIAKRLQADLALVHDVCHNTNTPKVDKNINGDINGGDGPCIEWTSQNHREILKKIKSVANREFNNIKTQSIVGSYGNDTVSFFLENTPTAIIATPLKYMHTTIEMAHKKDVKAAIELFYQTLISIDNKWIKEINNPIDSYLLS